MSGPRVPWLAVHRDLGPRRNAVLGVLAFVLPLAVWSAFSYVPFLWHPKVLVTAKGDTFLGEGKRYDPEAFRDANVKAVAEGKAPAAGEPANPVFLPAPHEVLRALVLGFREAPLNASDSWLHERIFESLRVIFWGFFWASVIGVPLGILCGSFLLFSRLTEPFVDFIRYMPAPAFGTLLVAILGTQAAPKVAVIFVGTFFQMVLVLANTTRQTDPQLLEAAQTLGAGNRRLLTRVIVPGALPRLYVDMRILLGWAWTYLIVAELIGEKSGITAYIQQQGRYFNFDKVYAGIIIIGLLGLASDQILQVLGRRLFPWEADAATGPSFAARIRAWAGEAPPPARSPAAIAAAERSAPRSEAPSTHAAAGLAPKRSDAHAA
ncbi:MAG TPA: ABC transporter permease subunit [Myxococcota bacterium]|nr:ABC transporter permease subunit [Myxococcota bacterium]